MTRVKRGNVARKRRQKIIKLAKGFRGSHNPFRTANQQVMKALRSACDRKSVSVISAAFASTLPPGKWPQL